MEGRVSRAVLLGPQRHEPNLAEAVDSLATEGTLAAVTAGWEEREAEDKELIEHLSRPVRNLALFPRGQEILMADRELFEERRRRQDRLRALRELYLVQLGALMEVAGELLAHEESASDGSWWSEEAESAIASVRELDHRHAERVRQVMADFEDRMRVAERPSIVRHREAVGAILDEAGLLCIAGGHVGVLLEHLQLFDVIGRWTSRADRPLVAWSGGAMVACERVVLFHDRPPEGRGGAEVHAPGLAAVPGVVALPHAATRLRLEDRARVALFARRFEPSVCFALDRRARLDWVEGRWHAAPGTRSLGRGGSLEEPS